VTWLVFLSVWSSLVETVGRRDRRPFHTLGDEHDKGAQKSGSGPNCVVSAQGRRGSSAAPNEIAAGPAECSSTSAAARASVRLLLPRRLATMR
jgi:hypothetical protein